MKKLLLLGGSAQQVIAIKTAKRLGYYTVLCDFLPDNPGQYAADKFYLVSTTDREAVLEVARAEQIHGVLAYASDPAAPTAAYVAEQMGLRTNPLAAVETLCNKDKFRDFLVRNGFHAPQSCGYTSSEAAVEDVARFHLPVIIKPVDSSGSKGVTVVRTLEDVRAAIDAAFSYSRGKRIIVEEFIEKSHDYLIGGDVFVSEGKVVLWGLMNCHRDADVNPLVPVGKSYPPLLKDADLRATKQTIQEMVTRLGIQFGAMNVELIVDREGRVFPIDIGPRNGGNMIPELLGLIFGVDVVEMSVQAAMGKKVDVETQNSAVFYATHNLHSDRNGKFKDIRFSQTLEKHLIRKCIYKKEGDSVAYFDNAAKAIGIVFMKFDTREEMHEMLSGINGHIMLEVEP